MDQRITAVTNLKNNIAQRSLIQNLTSTHQSNQQPLQQDYQYQFARRQVIASNFFCNCNKHVKIRLNGWIDRLDKIKTNRVWISNRNNYIKLLSLMCHCQHLAFPFLQLPPQDDLPHLKKHEITKIIDEVEREVKTSRFNSRKPSVNLQHFSTSQKVKNIGNSDQKRFQTDYNTFVQDQSQTLPMRKCYPPKIFQTDLQERTISFNRVDQYDKNCFTRPTQHLSEEQFENIPIEEAKAKPPRSSSQSSKGDLRQLTNYSSKATAQRINPSQSFYKSVKSSKPPLSRSKKTSQNNKTTQDKQNQSKHRQYWQSNELTVNNSGCGTPKYMDSYPLITNKTDQVVIVSYRQGDNDNCDCTAKMLGEGWLSQLFKKIIL